MKRYRYISNGCVLGKDKICSYRLIAKNNIKASYNGAIAIRVNIPEDLELTKYSCDPYSTTDDERTIDELGYDVLIWNEGKSKWEIHNEFKGVKPCDIPLNL
ncbi:hypothetical protein [Bacillus stercoris]|uniref:hypothetical protein n=1 Tax=Bacillus stercoris TaxID=2054641 RepID=UPI002209DA5F|nr:hypothetical protein [Bacillus phage PK-3]